MTEAEYKKMQEVAMELESYAELEGTEIGELSRNLIELVSYTPYMSKAFTKALGKELLEQLNSFKENTTIVEEVEKIERPIKRLEWND